MKIEKDIFAERKRNVCTVERVLKALLWRQLRIMLINARASSSRIVQTPDPN